MSQNMRMHKKIKVKLLFVQIIAILPFLLFIFYLFDLWYDSRRTLILEQNIRYAKLAGELFKSSMKNSDLVTEMIRLDPSFYETLNSEEGMSTKLLKNLAYNVQNIYGIEIADRNGKIIDTSFDDRNLLSGYESEEIKYIRTAIADKKSAVSPVLGYNADDKKIMVVATPVVANGDVISVIITLMDMDALKKNIESSLSPKYFTDNYLIFLDDAGEIIFVAGEKWPLASEKKLLADTRYFKEARTGNVYFIENQNMPLVNKTIIGASLPINIYGWVVISASPQEEVFSPVFKMQSVIWLVIFSALLFSFTLITFHLRRVKIIF